MSGRSCSTVQESALRSRQVSKIRAAAAELNAELDAVSMSDETEKFIAQRQNGDEVRHRREYFVTKELVAHGARGNEDQKMQEERTTVMFLALLDK